MGEIFIYVPPMPGGNLFLPSLHGGIACESHIKKDTRKNITKNIARKDHQDNFPFSFFLRLVTLPISACIINILNFESKNRFNPVYVVETNTKEMA